jgi:nucleoside-diphosphate-sugar epimerase
VLEQFAADLKDKSILITGGSGFFGKNLCSALVAVNASLDLNLKIYALARTKVELPGVQFIQQDVSTPFSFQEKIDYIIHAATPVANEEGQFDKIMNIIINGTQQTLNFAEKIHCAKFLLVSSGAVYGEQPQEMSNIPEEYVIKESFYDSKSAYSTGKRVSELMAMEWSKRTGAHLSIARCFAFSGRHLPIDQHLAIGNFVRDAIASGMINVKGDGTAIRSYMDADDLVVWLLKILLHGEKGQVYNVGSDEEITMKKLAEKIASKVSGSKVSIQNTQLSNSKRSKYVPSIEKAKKSLGLKIEVNLDESIQKMIDFNRGLV